jgi:hypothetical protein
LFVCFNFNFFEILLFTFVDVVVVVVVVVCLGYATVVVVLVITAVVIILCCWLYRSEVFFSYFTDVMTCSLYYSTWRRGHFFLYRILSCIPSIWIAAYVCRSTTTLSFSPRAQKRTK